MKDRDDILDFHSEVSNQFRKLFIAYTGSFNNTYGTHGGIFSTPFKRILVDNDDYFTQLIYYIHYNPLHHKICQDIRIYPDSSYSSFLSEKPTLLQRDEVLDWFGGKEAFIKYHALQNESFIQMPFYME